MITSNILSFPVPRKEQKSCCCFFCLFIFLFLTVIMRAKRAVVAMVYEYETHKIRFLNTLLNSSVVVMLAWV